MEKMVDVTIPMDAEAARTSESPVRREALGRYLSELLKGGRIRDALAEAIADAKSEARATGLTDDNVDAEIEAWRAGRRS